MTRVSPSQLPELPPSVAEWEDLLLKLEIMPRVLRNTLEEVRSGDAAAVELLQQGIAREAEVSMWLEALATGDSARAPAEAVQTEELRDLSDRFASLRARSFAMVQRRGLEVWEWAAEFAAEGRVTVYQVLNWLVQSDIQLLAALRERRGARPVAC